MNKNFSKSLKYFLFFFLIVFTSLFFLNCGGGSFNENLTGAPVDNGPPGSGEVSLASYKVGGTVSGLGNGRTITLQNNSTDNLTLSMNSNFSFPSEFQAGSTYLVTILNQPVGQTCMLANANGTMANAAVTNIEVNCTFNDLRIYLTQSNHNPNFSNGFSCGIAGADAFCMADANRPSDLVIAKAMIVNSGATRRACTSVNCASSGNSEHVDWVFKANRNYVRLDGTTLVGTTDNNGLLPFPLIHNLGGSGRTYYTGMGSTWQTSGFDCNQWVTTTGPGTAFSGHDNAVNPTATQFLAAFGAGLSCSTSVGLVCVEQ